MQQLHKRTATIPSHDLPKRAACKFRKQTNQTVPGKQTRVIEEHAGILSAEKLPFGTTDFQKCKVNRSIKINQRWMCLC